MIIMHHKDEEYCNRVSSPDWIQLSKALMLILKQIIYMGLPLLYMLWTFRRTYKRELDICSSTRSS